MKKRTSKSQPADVLGYRAFINMRRFMARRDLVRKKLSISMKALLLAVLMLLFGIQTFINPEMFSPFSILIQRPVLIFLFLSAVLVGYSVYTYTKPINEDPHEVDNPHVRFQNGVLPEDQLDELTNLVKDSILQRGQEAAIAQLKEGLEQSYRRHEIDQTFEDSRNRLQEEIANLGRRCASNLALGVIITIIGLSILGGTILFAPQGNREELLLYFGPRISLAIIVEVFAYFFLKLHREGILSIKYFQNEITNIESKFIGLSASFVIDSTEARHEAIQAFSKTERNSVIDKGQTTVDLERLRIENENTNLVLDQFRKSLRGLKLR